MIGVSSNYDPQRPRNELTSFAARRFSSLQRYADDFTDGPLIVQFPSVRIHNGR